MNYKRYAKKRVPHGIFYWFISTSSNVGGMCVCKCRENGHPIDDEHFATHNYYLTKDDANADMIEYTSRELFKIRYNYEFRAFKEMSPEKKRRYRKKLIKQIEEEDMNDDNH